MRKQYPAAKTERCQGQGSAETAFRDCRARIVSTDLDNKHANKQYPGESQKRMDLPVGTMWNIFWDNHVWVTSIILHIRTLNVSKPGIYVSKESDKLGDAVKLPATNRCSQIRTGYRLPAPATPSLFSLFRKRFTFKCSFTKSIFQESLAQRNGQTVA